MKGMVMSIGGFPDPDDAPDMNAGEDVGASDAAYRRMQHRHRQMMIKEARSRRN